MFKNSNKILQKCTDDKYINDKSNEWRKDFLKYKNLEYSKCKNKNYCNIKCSNKEDNIYNIETIGKVKDVIYKSKYYKLNKICPGKNNIPFEIRNKTDLYFTTLNVFDIEFSVYPIGCPMVTLPILLEIDNDLDDKAVPLTLKIKKNTNSIRIYGSIPAKTIFRFYTDCNLLRYFTEIDLKGILVKKEQLNEIEKTTERDENTKVIYINNRPDQLSLLPPIDFPPPGENILLPIQYPAENSFYPWQSSIIPWKKNQDFPSGPDVIITPPSDVPPVNPFVNGYNDEYAKFRSVPDSILYYLGYIAEDVSPTQPDLTIFLRNFQDRGYAKCSNNQEEWEYANFAKRQYMNAFSLDKIQFYEDKINSFVNLSYSEIVSNRKPFTSSFQKNVTLFFLKIHIGEHIYPDYVFDYFNNFIKFIGIGDPFNSERNGLLVSGHINSSQVFDYFKEKATDNIYNEDYSTVSYWWNLAGLSIEALLFESVHNIVAFSQFTNVLYSVIYSSINPVNPINPLLPNYPNFLIEYSNSSSDSDRLNIVREIFRLLVPNSNSFSSVNPSTKSTQIFQARHLHQQIMIENNPGSTPTEKAFSYFSYNPNLYNPSFSTDFKNIDSIDFSNDFLDFLPTSPLDQETVIDKSRPFIPIFPKPIYSPFGLGYRRCAGEIFVYFVTDRILSKFSKAQFEIFAGSFDTVYVGPFKGVPDNIFAIQPFNNI